MSLIPQACYTEAKSDGLLTSEIYGYVSILKEILDLVDTQTWISMCARWNASYGSHILPSRIE